MEVSQPDPSPVVLRNPPPPYRLILIRIVLAASLYLCLSSLQVLDSVGSGGLFILLMGLYIATGGGHTLYLMWHTLGRDARGAFRYLRLLSLMYYYQRLDLTVPRMFKRTVQAHPRRKALLYQDVSWTFTDLDEYSNKVANYFLQQGYKRGNCIALQMHNRPEYVGLWLGMAKIGVVPALINTNLRGQGFLHSLKEVSATACVVGTDDLPELKDTIESSCQDLKMYYSGSTDNGFTLPKGQSVNLDAELTHSSPAAIPESIDKANRFSDKLLYIYTSGTTGMPKAAVIKHSRFFFYCAGMFYMNNMGNVRDPVFYDPLPLYHSAGGVVGVGLMMVFGVTIVLRRKFSVRNFWKDCCQYGCNGAQYIGEICRYLLSAPETPEEKRHRVEIIFGNGLRPQIWGQFTQRFGIYRVAEFYGATEGNSNIMNIDSIPGSVGFASVLFPFVYPVRLIRVKEETGEVYRDPDTGLAVLCKPGEPGEFVGKIVKGHPSRSFDGYVNEKATQKKIVGDVLHRGDLWFRSGDLLTMDEFGWMYFVDRLGDTFRWKGENVSTMEVEAVISGCLRLQDAIAYGVEVPGMEGRAGMAAVVAPSGSVTSLDLERLGEELNKRLPAYAVPIFLRVVEELDITGTFKMKKLSLQREGYNVSTVSDPLFFFDSSKGGYRPLDHATYDDLVNLKVRL